MLTSSVFALLLPTALALALSSPHRRLVADERGWFPCSAETVDFPEDAVYGQGVSAATMRTNFSAHDIVSDQLEKHQYMELNDNRLAQCAVYRAPLCYEGICEDPEDRTVDIFFKRIQASDEDPSKYPNVWFIQGGPGASSILMEYSMLELYELMEGKVNVYTMDHRGTGRSTKLECVGAQAYTSGSPEGQVLSSIEVPECSADLHQHYGNLSSFSITTAATDLATFIGTETAESETYMYGLSYGTVLGERLIHLKPKEIKGYILDGIATTSGASADKFFAFSKWEDHYGEVGDTFLSRCETTPECSARFPKRSLTQVVERLIQKLEENPASPCGLYLHSVYDEKGEPPSFLVRRFLGHLLTSQRDRTLIPVLAHRLERCNQEDLKILEYFIRAYIATRSESDPASLEYASYDSDLMYRMIRYSEQWERPCPDEETMLQRFLKHRVVSGNIYNNILEYCAFSKEQSTVCDKYNVSNYDAPPLVFHRDQYFNQSATIPEWSSVLLMNGELDPQTPPKYAQALYDAMNGDEDQKQLVLFPNNVHALIFNTVTSDPSEPTCAMQMLASYVYNHGNLSQTNFSCLDRMPPMSFQVPEDLVQQLLNTNDPFDGALHPPPPCSDAEESNSSGMVDIEVNGLENQAGEYTTTKDNANETEDTDATSYKAPFVVFTVLFVIAAGAAIVATAKLRQVRREQTSKYHAQALTPQV